MKVAGRSLGIITGSEKLGRPLINTKYNINRNNTSRQLYQTTWSTRTTANPIYTKRDIQKLLVKLRTLITSSGIVDLGRPTTNEERNGGNGSSSEKKNKGCDSNSVCLLI